MAKSGHAGGHFPGRLRVAFTPVRDAWFRLATRVYGPGTKTRVDVGINLKGVKGTARLVEQPAGGMCQYKVAVTDPKEVDKELVGWVKQAFDAAG